MTKPHETLPVPHPRDTIAKLSAELASQAARADDLERQRGPLAARAGMGDMSALDELRSLGAERAALDQSMFNIKAALDYASALLAPIERAERIEAIKQERSEAERTLTQAVGVSRRIDAALSDLLELLRARNDLLGEVAKRRVTLDPATQAEWATTVVHQAGWAGHLGNAMTVAKLNQFIPNLPQVAAEHCKPLAEATRAWAALPPFREADE